MNVDEALRQADKWHIPGRPTVESTLAAEVRRLRAVRDGALMQHAEQYAELQRLRDRSPTVPCECGRTIHVPGMAELAAKVEAGEAVVRAWETYRADGHVPDFELQAALDELARVHGEGS